MSSQAEEAYMELVFVRQDSVNQQEKIKSFWKFLDAHDYLQAHKGMLEHKSPPEIVSSVSSAEKVMEEKDVWRKGLKVFQQFGLDKTALAVDSKCKLCLVHRTIQSDARIWPMITQTYDELNADMKAYEQRQETRGSDRRKIPYSGTAS